MYKNTIEKNSLIKIASKYNLNEQIINNRFLYILEESLKELDKFKNILLLTCSNRYQYDKNNIDIPKSKILSMIFNEALKDKSKLIDITELKIYPCEGNVSRAEGNECGLKKATLKDYDKNPTGDLRCWASVNNKDDELWKISKELFNSDIVLFFSSVRWGQTNMHYQKLIERLTWLENRHTTLGENNIIKDINSGFICTGQNWNGIQVVNTQKMVHKFFGFKTNDKLYWNWQYTDLINDETQKSYKNSHKKFNNDFNPTFEV